MVIIMIAKIALEKNIAKMVPAKMLLKDNRVKQQGTHTQDAPTIAMIFAKKKTINSGLFLLEITAQERMQHIALVLNKKWKRKLKYFYFY